MKPNKIVRIKLAAAAAGVSEAAIANVLEARERGEFKFKTMPEWLSEQHTRRPQLFAQAGDLEAAAFERGSLAASGQLVKTLGEAGADARARAWNLNGVADLTKGTRPGSDEGKKSEAARANPWANDPTNVDKHGRFTAARHGPAVARRPVGWPKPSKAVPRRKSS